MDVDQRCDAASDAPASVQQEDDAYLLMGGFKVYTQTHDVIPSAQYGIVQACLAHGFVSRYTSRFARRSHGKGAGADRWVVRLSGHKKGSNPRIKLEDGRLWSLSIPEACSLLQTPTGPAVFARPVGTTECHQLYPYTKQPLEDAMIVSLTDGADKCYLRNALHHTHFQFVFALVTNLSGQPCWFVTEEIFHVTREPAPKKASTLRSRDRLAPDGAPAAAAFTDESAAATALFKSHLAAEASSLQQGIQLNAVLKTERAADEGWAWAGGQNFQQYTPTKQQPSAQLAATGNPDLQNTAGCGDSTYEPFSFVDPEFDPFNTQYQPQPSLQYQQAGLMDPMPSVNKSTEPLSRLAGPYGDDFSFVDPEFIGMDYQGWPPQ